MSKTKYTLKNNKEKLRSNTNDFEHQICVAIALNRLSELRSLLNSSNVNMIIDHSNNNTIMHIAVLCSSSDIIDYLLKLGADINLQNINNKTCIDICNSLSICKQIYNYYLSKTKTELISEVDKKNVLQTRLNYIDSNYKKLESNNEKQKSEITILQDKIIKLEKQVENITEENNHNKRKADEAELAFINLRNTKK